MVLNEIGKTTKEAGWNKVCRYSFCHFRLTRLLDIQVQIHKKQLDMPIGVLGIVLHERYMFGNHLCVLKLELYSKQWSWLISQKEYIWKDKRSKDSPGNFQCKQVKARQKSKNARWKECYWKRRVVLMKWVKKVHGWETLFILNSADRLQMKRMENSPLGVRNRWSLVTLTGTVSVEWCSQSLNRGAFRRGLKKNNENSK